MSDYFSKESETKYMSNHQYSAWQSCEARAYAEYVTHEYKRETSDAFIQGLYFEALYAGQEYTNEALRNKKGELYAKFANCPAMAIKCQKDKLFRMVASGEWQTELFGKIQGHDFKCKLDYINHGKGWICDLKTTADFSDRWMNLDGKNTKVKWYEEWNYWRQMAIQKELAEQTYGKRHEVYIAAVTKQAPPNLDVLDFNNPKRLNLELISMASRLDRIKWCKQGKVELTRCGFCDYCRSTKKLTTITKAESVYG